MFAVSISIAFGRFGCVRPFLMFGFQFWRSQPVDFMEFKFLFFAALSLAGLVVGSSSSSSSSSSSGSSSCSSSSSSSSRSSSSSSSSSSSGGGGSSSSSSANVAKK